jgi:hypothetical protein
MQNFGVNPTTHPPPATPLFLEKVYIDGVSHLFLYVYFDCSQNRWGWWGKGQRVGGQTLKVFTKLAFWANLFYYLLQNIHVQRYKNCWSNVLALGFASKATCFDSLHPPPGWRSVFTKFLVKHESLGSMYYSKYYLNQEARLF